jgi:hypothetical protein
MTYVTCILMHDCHSELVLHSVYARAALPTPLGERLSFRVGSIVLRQLTLPESALAFARVAPTGRYSWQSGGRDGLLTQ